MTKPESLTLHLMITFFFADVMPLGWGLQGVLTGCGSCSQCKSDRNMIEGSYLEAKVKTKAMQGSTDLQRLKVPPETTEKGKNPSRILVGDFKFRYLNHNNMIKLIITVSISDWRFFSFIVLELSYEGKPKCSKWILNNQSHQAKKLIRESFQATIEKDIYDGVRICCTWVKMKKQRATQHRLSLESTWDKRKDYSHNFL